MDRIECSILSVKFAKKCSILLDIQQLLALICYLLTYTFEWHALVYIIGAIAIIGVSVLLQRYLKVFRIIYALFTCVAISFLVLMFKGYDSEKEIYAIFAISFIVTAVWEFISWKTIIYK